MSIIIRKWFLIFNAGVCLVFLILSNVVRAEVIKMDREEVIQRSNLIFVGNVLKKTSRWNEKGNLIVTDYAFSVDEVLFGKTGKQLTLTFAGGQLQEEGQSISDVPEFNEGDRVLLMIEEDGHPLLSPVTGMYQGKFTAGETDSSGKRVVLNGRNKPIKSADNKSIHFDDFVELIKKELLLAKSRPLPSREVPDDLTKFIIQDLPCQIYDASSRNVPLAEEQTYTPKAPMSSDNIQGKVPPRGDAMENYFDDSEFTEIGGEEPREWSYSHRAKTVPIVFNPLPNNGGLISLHDQYQMSYWNVYADIFRVINSTGFWAWRNDRYDIAGFVDNQTMIAQFGQGWGSTTLGVCWIRWDSTGFSIEADIALNPAFSWTTDDYATYSNNNLHNADHALLHEIGHSWGLDHQFSTLSVMNYAPHKYRAYTVLYGDDTMAVRSAFSPQAVSRTDVGVYLFYGNFYDSMVSTQTVAPGSSITVSNFTIDNSGTNATTPQIDWWLVPNINSWANPIYLGTRSYGLLNPDYYMIPSSTLTIPSNIPPGNYYLGAYVSGYDSVYDNNSSWLDRVITVSSPQVTYFNINNGASGTTSRTVTLNNAATGSPTQYMASESPSFSGAVWQAYSTAPSFTLSSGNSTKTVYFKVRNAANTESTAVNDSITLNEATASTLTSFYTFNEGYGTVAGDSSGNGNHGSINGATWTMGKSGSALSFSGNNSYVTKASPSSALKPSSEVAISAWIKTSSRDINGAEVVSMGDSYALRINTNGTIKFFYYNGSTWYGVSPAGVNVLDGGWHHVVGQKTSTRLEVYVDGVLKGIINNTGTIAYTLGNNFFIGKHGNNDTTYDFNGIIDDVRTYNKALSAQEVLNLYNQYSGGLVSRWKLDEGFGTFTYDSVNGNYGTINGATWTITADAVALLNFSGNNSYVTKASPSLALKPSTQVAITAWIKTSSRDINGAEVVSMGDSYAMRINPNGTIKFFYYNGSTWYGVSPAGVNVLDGGWHHVVGQKTSTRLEVYVDGVLKGIINNTGTIAYTLGNNFFIGKHGNNDTTYDFNGIIDDVRIYNRALSASEVLTLYNNPNSLMAQAVVDSDVSVTITWGTADEVDTKGFNLHRSRLKNGKYTRVNDALIIAAGDVTSSYSFVDQPGAGNLYYYKLESVDYVGVSTMHEPVKVKMSQKLSEIPF